MKLNFNFEFPAKKCLTECDFVLRLVTKLLNGSFKHLLILSIDFDLKIKGNATAVNVMSKI